jgi:ligand-binding sensor domain-containing protein/DNA-binding CsgD family transcriptional regulator
MYRLLYFLLFLLPGLNSAGQNTIGLPDITNHTKQAYGAGTQNWDIRQDRNGILYFANNEGLLTYDGSYWQLHPLPNRTIVRSLEIAPDHRIYVGAQDELGYFAPDQRGRLAYTSLKHLLPKNDNSFADVWDVLSFRNDLYFRTSHRIFQLTGTSSMKVYRAPNEWRFMGPTHGGLVAQDWKDGLLRLEDGQWRPFLEQNELPEGFLVTATLPLGRDSTLVTTHKNGIFLLQGNKLTLLPGSNQALFARSRIYTAVTVNKDWIALATSTDGCYIIDRAGNLIQSFARREGLQNNNILSLLLDREGNLWMGLDNGIDFVSYNSAIKHVFPGSGDAGSGYAAQIHDGFLYAGTSTGLFRVPLGPSPDLSFVKGSFEPVTGSQGQVWNLSSLNGRLFMGHHEGAFAVEGAAARLLDNSSGFWTFQPVASSRHPGLVAAGNYSGVDFFRQEGGKLEQTGIRARFESARFITLDDRNNLWVAHPYKGLYRIWLDASGKAQVKLYTAVKGLTVNNNYVFKVRNRVIVTTEQGILEYDAAADVFRPTSLFGDLFRGIPVRYLKEDPAGNIWFVHHKLLGIVEFSGPKPRILYFPELTNKLVSGFEHVFPADASNIFVGAEKGFYHINLQKYKEQVARMPVQLRSVHIFQKSDSMLFGGYFRDVNEEQVQGSAPSIRNDWNSIRFQFSAPLYSQRPNMEFSYMLDGFDRNWSEWTRRTEKDYTNLPPGTYTFRVKARNNLGNESTVASYRFTILPPWYLTWWAFTVYGLLALSATWYGYRHQKRKFEAQRRQHAEEQQRLQYLHQLELDKTEKELVKLRNEKLEAEIGHKNTELASAAMHLVQKGELLTKIRAELSRLMKTVKEEKAVDEFRRMIKALNEEDKMDTDWEQFAHHFDKVHSDFLVALKARFPNLSANELKLCAYLRMNLSSKEIAQLMNISVRGVEISRYRLRKKLQIPTEVNLFEYLLKLHPETATAEEPGGR